MKEVEVGSFPDTKRHFLPVLCNQCKDAPCERICPTQALHYRPDGIVDLDPARCIGCKACMLACPYDQLFIDPNTATAEKCNYCANRLDRGLEPACVVVCPTQCRIFGDLEDPTIGVSQIRSREMNRARKPEKGTKPGITYVGASDAVIRPAAAERPLAFQQTTNAQPRFTPLQYPTEITAREQSFLAAALSGRATPSTWAATIGDLPAQVGYDVHHLKPWGLRIVLYLLAKGIAAGAFFIAAILRLLGSHDGLVRFGGPALGMLFTLVTTALLVADLKRPERFLYILLKPNWRSWMTRGAFILVAFGGLATGALLAELLGLEALARAFLIAGLPAALMTSIYTGFFFAQAVARDLWQGSHNTLHIAAQSTAAGAGALLWLGACAGAAHQQALAWVLALGMLLHVATIVFEVYVHKSPSQDHELALAIVRRFAHRHLMIGCGLFAAVGAALFSTSTVALVGMVLLAYVSMLLWEHLWVHAGQEVPLS
ncbi:MAG: 4Fe-4S dicluster domain-containing protein [Planctomycetota bacterium]